MAPPVVEAALTLAREILRTRGLQYSTNIHRDVEFFNKVAIDARNILASTGVYSSSLTPTVQYGIQGAPSAAVPSAAVTSAGRRFSRRRR